MKTWRMMLRGKDLGHESENKEPWMSHEHMGFKGRAGGGKFVSGSPGGNRS